MRLGAAAHPAAQPAYIRVTRRRSALPRPSSSAPQEDRPNDYDPGRIDQNGNERQQPPELGLTAVVPYQLRAAYILAAPLVGCNALLGGLSITLLLDAPVPR
jgi:hypothetical protein